MTVATLTLSPEVVATRTEPCSFCSEPIVKDEDYVATIDGCNKGWMHATCAAAYIRHRELFEELNQDDDASASDGSAEF